MKALRDYQGRRVRLTPERWAHIQEHPEMQGMEEAVAKTLARPEGVVQSLADAEAHLYHRFYVGTRVADKYLCVVVKIQEDDAVVVTAYLTDHIRKGVVLWRAKS